MVMAAKTMTEGALAQLVLGMGEPPSFAREDLIETPSNHAAIRLIDTWPQWPSPVAILAGPKGSGKSHIGAAWQQVSGALQMSLDAVAAGEHVSGAADRPVLIDDVDFYALDAARQTTLFHIINSVRQNGTQLLLCTSKAPDLGAIGLPDLASRLRAANFISLDAPDDLLLTGVLTKLFADRQLAVDGATIAFLVARMERSLAAANHWVERIDNAALVAKKRISKNFVSQLMSKHQ